MQKRTLEADFLEDWRLQVMEELLAMGYQPDQTESVRGLSRRYFNVLWRKIGVAPRQVLLAEGVECPPDLENGYKKLLSKVRLGEDLNPHLSRLEKKLNRRDLLLNDWGIYHFHLGDVMESDGYVNRTGPLLFARVTGDCFFVIGIFDHGDWGNQEYLQVLHDNWPESIAGYRLKGVTGVTQNVNSNTRKLLRKKSISSCIELSRGVVYFPPGGGFLLDGSSSRVDRESIKFEGSIQALEEHLKNNLNYYMEDAKSQSIELPNVMRFRLKFEYPFFKVKEQNSGYQYLFRYQ